MRQRSTSAYAEYKRQQRRRSHPWLSRVLAILVVIGLLAGTFLLLSRASQVALIQQGLPTTSLDMVVTKTRLPDGALADIASAMTMPSPMPILQATQSGNSDFSSQNLAKSMLALINADRKANGLNAVEWDDLAAQVGEEHAVDMVEKDYFSHWNTKGYGPDMRYAFAGGKEVVQENLYRYWYRFSNGTPAPITAWDELLRDAETGLIDSPSHRANILDAAHTHVGVGIAYNPKTGEVRLAQEFLNRYATLSEIPNKAKKGQDIRVSGALLLGAHDPIINVAFEPATRSTSIWDLNNTIPHTYLSAAKSIQAIAPDVSGSSFSALINVGESGAGLYHIRIWATHNEIQIMAAEAIIVVS